MSTNKTPNYQLHSWTPDDEFHVSEINENFTKLDAAVKEEAQAAATGRSALNTAIQAETAARSQAMSKRPEVVFGRYKGDGSNRHFDLDRAPAAVHISIEAGTDSGIFIGDSGSKYGVTVDDTGFSLVAQCFNNVTRYYTYAAYFL